MKRIHLVNEPDYMAKMNAFSYQKKAVDAIKDLEYSAVFHEQGLGKTKIAIDLLLYWLNKTSIDSVMIVTKKQLIQNWTNEFALHTSVKPSILSTDRNSNYHVFNGPARIVIANFEMIVSEYIRVKLYLKTRNVAIIIDESAKLKNPHSKLTQTFFDLSPLFKKRVIMTGTPVANRPYDIWAQIYFLDNGKSLGKNFGEFKKQTDISNNLFSDLEKQKEFEDEVSAIFCKIDKFSVRETKRSGVINLPAKVILKEVASFQHSQQALYDKIQKELEIQILKDGEVTLDDSSVIIKRLLRLVQVASNPRMIDDSFRGPSAKEIVLDRLIAEIIAAGQKCIVWSSFIENIEEFSKKYSEYGCVKIHGGMKIGQRNLSVSNFGLKKYNLLFATPASAKEGLTLTMANHVIFYDRSFSLDDYLQAQDRIHRISQKQKCFIHNIIVENSIDEWVDLLLDAKHNAALLAQGDISLDEYSEVSDYSYGDILKEILLLGRRRNG